MISSSSSEAAAIPPIERVKRLLAILLLAAAALAWWPKLFAYFHRAASPAGQKQSIYYKIDNEQGWIVNEVGRRIAETMAFAKGELNPDAALHYESNGRYDRDQLRYELTVSLKKGTAKAAIETKNYFLSPEMFAPWFASLQQALHVDLRAESTRVDSEFVQRLTSPRPSILIQEDFRISELLSKKPLSAQAHEEAALLIGSLALREANLEFNDARPALIAMSSHLTMAKSLSGNLSACGRLAEAVLCSLLGRQAAAVAIVDLLQTEAGRPNDLPEETATAWGRALRTYNTGDYRIVADPEHASLLEQLEHFRALRYGIGSHAASDFAEKYPLEKLSEWSARLMAGSTSVQEENRWMAHALSRELEECARIHRAYEGIVAAGDSASSLNAHWRQLKPASGSSRPFQVLGWGAWAEMRQRELCELIEEMFYSLNQMLGVPEEAKTFRTEITKQFGSLDLFPLISFDDCEPPAAKSELTAAERNLFTAERPKISFARWNKLFLPTMKNGATSAAFKALSPMLGWYQSKFFPGTAYDIRFRAEQASGTMTISLSPDELCKLREIAPFNTSLLWNDLRQATNYHPTPEQTAAQFDYVGQYNVWAMRLVADNSKNDPERFAELYNRVCQLEPARYIDLGDYLRDHGKDEAAAVAYQNAFDHSPDRVQVSNSCGWLVNYYFDHGRKADAFKIAEDAADAYSARGLETMAQLLERSGRLPEAEEYYRKIDNRYEGHTEVGAFYFRNRTKSSQYASAAHEQVARVFPKGLESAKIEDLVEPPTDGVKVTGWSGVTQKIGMQVGDILVAIDGLRLHNQAQYFFLRDGAIDPNISYLVWRKTKYIQIRGYVPNRQIRASIADFPAQ
jgi:hypothetical protein